MASLVLDSTSMHISIPLVSTISIVTTNPSISTIVSILDTKELSTRTVEPKAQLSTKFLGKGKEIEEDIDLDEEIVIPKWDIYNLFVDQMQIIGEILQKKAK